MREHSIAGQGTAWHGTARHGRARHRAERSLVDDGSSPVRTEVFVINAINMMGCMIQKCELHLCRSGASLLRLILLYSNSTQRKRSVAPVVQGVGHREQ